MQLADLIGFLNTIGCLKRNRAITFYPRAWCKQLVHGIHGVWYQPLRRRGHTSLAAITHGIGRATVPVTLATLLTLGLLVCLLPSQAAPIIAKGGFVWLAFICSMVLHEYGHFKSIKHYRVGCDVLQYGMHIGLIHGKLPSLAEIYVAIAGPFCGIVACSLFIVLAMYALPGTPLLILFVGILHLCSLLPWYGDGKSLRLAHNQRKKANEIRTHSS
jgi:hypothetical protein